jgi:hypothetical protein
MVLTETSKIAALAWRRPAAGALDREDTVATACLDYDDTGVATVDSTVGVARLSKTLESARVRALGRFQSLPRNCRAA